MIDTHSHIDDEQFADDLSAVIDRAKAAGVERIFVPSTDLWSCGDVVKVTRKYPGYLYPMLGLHPEEVTSDYKKQLKEIRAFIDKELAAGTPVVAIGEIGLDFYGSREYEKQQTKAFIRQISWGAELKLPLMIHIRKAQNEAFKILKEREKFISGGVFHCFTGNEQEAEQLLQFEKFMLGIGGVVTFKNSNLPSALKAAVPLSRIVIETDAPYMAPVPRRGRRNESSYTAYIRAKLAEIYEESEETVDRITTENALKVFRLPDKADASVPEADAPAS